MMASGSKQSESFHVLFQSSIVADNSVADPFSHISSPEASMPASKSTEQSLLSERTRMNDFTGNESGSRISWLERHDIHHMTSKCSWRL